MVADPNFTHSTLRESIIEHLFVGELLRHMWVRGLHNIEVLSPAIDAHGYDVVVGFQGITRHVQLKTLSKTGKASGFKVHRRLSEKDSGCVIAIIVDTNGLKLDTFLYFGGEPGEPLPPIGTYPIAKHTKGDSTGRKRERINHRVVPKSAFRRLQTIEDVVQALFGVKPDTVADAKPSLSNAISDELFDYLPKAEILAAYERAPGNELDKKFASDELSAALVANAFGFFLRAANRLMPIPNTEDLGWPARGVRLEECLHFRGEADCILGWMSSSRPGHT